MTQQLAQQIKQLKNQRQQELRAEGLPISTPHRHDSEIDRLTEEKIAVQEYQDQVSKMSSVELLRAYSLDVNRFVRIPSRDEGFSMAGHKLTVTNTELLKRLDNKQ